jgi:hypothetical protein
MKRNVAISLKAFFLLGVFSFNMIIGFVCATGIDKWFISHHLEKTKITAHEGSRPNDGMAARPKSKGCKDDCCNEHVVRISQGDKSLPQSSESLNVIFVTALISSFYNIDVLRTSKVLADSRYFVRSHHPPIPDIRIAIQSFQI